MRGLNIIVSLILALGIGAGESLAQEGELTLRRAVSPPSPGFAVPRKLAFIPSGDGVTYLKNRENELVQDLWQYTISTGNHAILVSADTLGGGAKEGELSIEEELRRARLRELGEGLTQYQWAAKVPTLLLPVKGDLYVWKDGRTKRVTETPAPELGASLSAHGETLAFVREGQLFTMTSPFDMGSEKAISAKGSEDIFFGMAEYIAQEELGRMEGFWLSPSGDTLVFTKVDQSMVTEFPIVHQGGNPWGKPLVENHRYPFAGEKNASVSLHIADVDSGRIIPVPVPGIEDGYLMDVQWVPGTDRFVVSLLDRSQKVFQGWESGLLGKPTLLFEERSDTWIDNPGPVVFYTDEKGNAGGFYRVDASTGWARIRRHERRGQAAEFMTAEGTWVDGIVGLDSEGGWLFFEGSMTDARQRHVYRIPASGGIPERLSGDRGVHSATVSSQGKSFLHFGGHREEPASVVLRGGDGASLSLLHAPDRVESDALGLIPPEEFDVTLADGTVLHGYYYAPLGTKPERGWPAILSPYGGPTHQVVMDSWRATANLRTQYWTRKGFAVLKLDNRGTPRRGAAFSHAVYLDLGNLEIQDQVAGAEALVARKAVDPERMGIMGWSYGGYLSSMAMVKAPNTFRAAIVGAPVTDWRGYDTAYTERYMGMPNENKKGYMDSSVMEHMGEMRGEVLVVHGMIDENVHFRHSAALIESLLRNGQSHDVIVYPEARHSPRRVDEKVFVFEKVYSWFVLALSEREEAR